nr:hypothetical protein BaRGS_021739 [Batillaria attramentaria]
MIGITTVYVTLFQHPPPDQLMEMNKRGAKDFDISVFNDDNADDRTDDDVKDRDKNNDLEGGTFHVEVRYNGQDLYDNWWEICEMEEDLEPQNRTFSCPIRKGRQSLIKDKHIPGYLPKGFSHGAGDYDHASHGYEFIYHDSHLWHAVKVTVPETILQAGVIQWLSQPHHGAPTTLDNVRDEFRDRLADYHCMNREIYFFNITCESDPHRR